MSGDTYTTTAQYIWEGNSYYDPLVLGLMGGWRYPLYDGLGSTRQVLDANQNVTDTYVYEAFGNLMGSSGSTPNPYRFVGSLGYYQTGSSLQHLGARYYMPEVGRFLAPDPNAVGRRSYRYVGNSPATWADPSGLFAACDPTRQHCGETCTLAKQSDWSEGFEGEIIEGMWYKATSGARLGFHGPGGLEQLMCTFDKIKMYYKIGTVTMVRGCYYTCPSGDTFWKYQKEKQELYEHNRKKVGAMTRSMWTKSHDESRPWMTDLQRCEELAICMGSGAPLPMCNYF